MLSFQAKIKCLEKLHYIMLVKKFKFNLRHCQLILWNIQLTIFETITLRNPDGFFHFINWMYLKSIEVCIECKELESKEHHKSNC
jgi:hypothetical protein